MKIDFEGQTHDFPDDFTDQDIAKALQAKGPGQAAAPESGVTRFYKQYLAKPLTGAVSKGIQYGGTGLRALDPGEWPGLLRGDQGPSPVADTAAEFAVPQTPTQALTMAATGGAGKLASGLSRPLQALSRVTGGLIGNEAGNVVEGKPAGTGALATGGVLGAVEAAVPAVNWGRRIMPGAKARINEMQGSHLADALNTVSPDLGAAITGARKTVAPGTRGQTQAAIQETALGDSGQQALSQGMERAVQKIEGLTPNLGSLTVRQGEDTVPALGTQAIRQAYETMPALAKQQLVGEVGPSGFTLRQAQEIRSWLGSRAFKESPLGQGVGPVPQQKLHQQVTGDLETALGQAHPDALGIWKPANREYGGGTAMLEGLRGGNVFPGGPNSIALNRNALSEYLSQNRADLRQRMGPDQYEAVVKAVLEGGQVGTKDILAPAAGGAMDALRQVYGRGQGGAPQILGSLLRTGAPNIGSQYTGRAPFRASPGTQTIADLAALRALGVLPGSQP